MSMDLADSNDTDVTEKSAGLKLDLRAFASLCGEVLTLAQQENQALTGQDDYVPTMFEERRKLLLQAIENDRFKPSSWQGKWSILRHNPAVRSHEIQMLLTDIQNLLMRVFQLDRENQQAMLRRGLVPAQQLPSFVRQQPHFVTGLYQRHLMRH